MPLKPFGARCSVGDANRTSVPSVNRLIALSAFGRVSVVYVPDNPLSEHWNPRLAPFSGIDATALSCFPVQDLVRKMLDKNEVRL
jgi:hypothetical protein